MSLALELSSRRCIILTQCCGYSKQPWVQLFLMLALINKSISSSWLGFLLSVVNLLQCSLLHCNLKFLDCKLTIIIVFPKSLNSGRHMLLMFPLTEVFLENICQTIIIKWKSALSTRQKFIHFKIKINVLTDNVNQMHFWMKKLITHLNYMQLQYLCSKFGIKSESKNRKRWSKSYFVSLLFKSLK